MQFNKSVYLAILAATLASAATQSNSCSFETTTITAATGVQEINSCPTVTGSVEFNGDELVAIDLSAVKSVQGDLIFSNSSTATEILLSNLANITGKLDVNTLYQLHNIDLANLEKLNELSFVSLPSLATLNIVNGISEANSFEISDTALSHIPGLEFTTVSNLNFNNNKNITSITLPLTEVLTQLTLSFNSDNCTVNIDDLQWASNLTIQDVSSLSASNLTAVNGSCIISYNTFDVLNLDVLSNVGGSLELYANDDLESLDISNLTTIGGELHLANNTNLDDLSESFSSLETVKGAVSVTGSFSNFSLPALEKVNGDFAVETNNDDFSCDTFNKLKKSNVIEGNNFTCTAPAKSSSTSSSSASGTAKGSSASATASGSSSSSSSSSKALAGALYVQSTGLLTGLVGVALALL